MANIQKLNQAKALKRQARTRSKFSGTAQCPRASVFRSAKNLSIQLIDDAGRVTLAAVSTKEIKDNKLKPIEKALEAGKILAEKAKEKKIETVVFDRGRYKYHGRVAAAAEGMRAGGLKF